MASNSNSNSNQPPKRRVMSPEEIAAQAQQPRPGPRLPQNPADLIKTKEYKTASRRYVYFFWLGEGWKDGGRVTLRMVTRARTRINKTVTDDRSI